MSEGVIIIRPSFMKFCEDGCRAALFNHIFYWIGRKNKDQAQEVIQSGEITYYATTEELTELMANCWGGKKIRLEVNALIAMGIIGLGKNPKWGADRTKHFFFGKEQYTKLIELCKKHLICLAHIELPKEIINLLAAFSQIVECPCTEQKQMVNLPNANGKKAECPPEQMVKRPFANGQLTGAITKVSTKVSNTKVSNERMNDVGQQKSNVSAKQRSPSFTPSSSSLDKSFSEETKPEKEVKPEVVFTEKQMVVYKLAEERKYSRLKKDTNHQQHCQALVEADVTTDEKIDSLEKFCREKLSYKGPIDLCLGNLVTELNGWLQVQRLTQKKTSSGAKQIWEMSLEERNDYYKKRYGMPALAVSPVAQDIAATIHEAAESSMQKSEESLPITDDDIASKISEFSYANRDGIHIDENIQRAKQLKLELGVSCEDFYANLFEAQEVANKKGRTMSVFFEHLRRFLEQKLARAS